MPIFGTSQKPSMPKVGKYHSGPMPGVRGGGKKSSGGHKSSKMTSSKKK